MFMHVIFSFQTSVYSGHNRKVSNIYRSFEQVHTLSYIE